VDYKLELIVIPVTDMDPARTFYSERVGFHVDVDHRAGEDSRVIQLTPEGRPARSR
jgi:extradiol dioxygenase family protein